ncbi:MAG TPA: methyltransferase domain-containing protein, partial [Nocardioides sp.]|nr:methyltransferase domain-containing protein [Nocardioides sp.]
MSARVDADGIHFDAPFTGSGDVHFGGRRGWSFAATREQFVGWPRKLKPFLEGWSDVRVVVGEREVFSGRVEFSDADQEVALVGRHGDAIVVDKWGLVQRTFENRPPEAVRAIADSAEQMLEIMKRDCGIDGWISFGTLLGAARNGHAIGHDSDVDLCYVSEKTTPAEMTSELWGIARALRAAGIPVVDRTGSFVTAMMPAPDGSENGIDVYLTFFHEGQFYATATVRTPLERSAVLPLTELEFEGRMMPAPADPARLLEISYGPNWRVPDPSFKHEPGPEIYGRFAGWFGSLWRQRREWRPFNADAAQAGAEPSEFADWVAARLEPGTTVVDVGCGSGADVRHFAELGHPVVGLDYAPPPPRLRRLPENARIEQLNLYDDRDVLARAALAARSRGPQVVYARQVLEALEPDGVANFWRFTAMALRRGGRAYLEGESWPKGRAAKVHLTRGGGRLRPLAVTTVAA